VWIDPTTGAGFVALTNSDVFLSHGNQLEAGIRPVIGAMLDLETAPLALAAP